jgi:hypothetical protein
MMDLTRIGFCTKWFLSAAAAVMLASVSVVSRAETDPKFYAVMATADVQSSPAQITLRWNIDANATGYSIARRSGNSWSTVANLSGSTLSWTDQNVAAGGSYEYRLIKNTSLGYNGTSYLLAGINASLKDTLGKVILLVDSTYAAELSTELRRLEWDLAGDGWTVLRHDVLRSDSPRNIKEIIKADYYADPSAVKGVFIFGHVPVPYSGNFNPDGHPDHEGAWAADLYYGDMDGNWTDNSVSNTRAEKPWNHNIPGDGKFDQSGMPSDVEVAVGRVDFYNMTCYANKTPSRSELDLLRAYLNKDHNFRHRVFTVARRGLVCDNFGEFGGEAFAASGWRNLGAFFGADNVTKVGHSQYFPTLASEDYLWSYGTGGGSWYTCNGIGGSDDFATTEIKSVFTMFLGSYFGDWDNESAFLRAPLGSGYALTTSWAGRPHWYYHHMGLGEPIGVSTIASQNGVYGAGEFGRQVHVALLGDPTLRMHPVIPASNLQGTASGSTMSLTWSASTDSELQGYHVYRGSGPSGAFTRLTSAPVTGTSFSDNNYAAGVTYMVRAVKLERSGGGTYFNASQGIFFPENGGGGTAPQTPSAAANLSASAVSSYQINLAWQDTSSTENGFRIERQTAAAGVWVQVGAVGANVGSFSNAGLSPGTAYSYRVVAFNSAGGAPPSNFASATTATVAPTTPAATFAGDNRTASGTWKGIFGQDGFQIMTGPSLYPGYVTATTTGKTDHYWQSETSDPRALQTTGTARVAGCWYSATSFTVNFNFLDSETHKLSLYFMDWDRLGRSQRVEILDATTGAVLDTQTVSNFGNGIYLSWNVKGAVRARLTRLSGPNAILNGFFFDPAAGGGTGNTRGEIVAGNFNLQISGTPGERFDVYVSEDLRAWNKITTVTLDQPTYDFLDTASTGTRLRFYRAVKVP